MLAALACTIPRTAIASVLSRFPLRQATSQRAPSCGCCAGRWFHAHTTVIPHRCSSLMTFTGSTASVRHLSGISQFSSAGCFTSKLSVSRATTSMKIKSASLKAQLCCQVPRMSAVADTAHNDIGNQVTTCSKFVASTLTCHQDCNNLQSTSAIQSQNKA